MSIGDIMSKDPLYVDEDDHVTKARQLIRDSQLRGLPVLNRDGNVVGIVTIQDMLKITSTRSNVTVSGFVTETPLVTVDDDMEDVAKHLLTGMYVILPVVESADVPRLVGVVSPIDVFGHMDPEKIPDKNIGEIMSTKLSTCTAQDLVTKVWDKMLESDFTGLPVVDEKGKPLGMITRFDILKRGGARIGTEERVRSKDVMRVEQLMSTPLYSIDPKATLREAIGVMLKGEFGRISVVDDGKLVGIVDRHDLIEAIFGVVQ